MAIPVAVGSRVVVRGDGSSVPAPTATSRVYVRRSGEEAFEQLPYIRRAKFTYCANNYVKAVTVLWLLVLMFGLALQLTSPLRCADGCTEEPCTDQYDREWKCTCPETGACQSMYLAKQGIAGIAMIAIGAFGLVVQALFACTCCLCWVPDNRAFAD